MCRHCQHDLGARHHQQQSTNRTKLVVATVQGMKYPLTKEDMEQHAMIHFEWKYWMVGEPTYPPTSNCIYQMKHLYRLIER